MAWPRRCGEADTERPRYPRRDRCDRGRTDVPALGGPNHHRRHSGSSRDQHLADAPLLRRQTRRGRGGYRLSNRPGARRSTPGTRPPRKPAGFAPLALLTPRERTNMRSPILLTRIVPSNRVRPLKKLFFRLSRGLIRYSLLPARCGRFAQPRVSGTDP